MPFFTQITFQDTESGSESVSYEESVYNGPSEFMAAALLRHHLISSEWQQKCRLFFLLSLPCQSPAGSPGNACMHF